MKKWFSAGELSGLPGMPSTESAVIRKAKREHWFARYRQGQGGGKEYDLNSLPTETQVALHFKHLPVVKKDNELVIKEQVDQKLVSLKGWQREIFDARVALYREFERLQGQVGTNQAIEVMVEMAKGDALPDHLKQCVAQANARKGDERTISRSLILGWQRKVRRYGIAALAPQAVEKMTVPEWALYFMQFYQLPTNPTIPEAMEAMGKVLPEGMSMPSYHQVLRFHNKRSHLEREKGRKTGSAYKALKGYRQRDTSPFRPLDIGVCDGHSFKAKVSHPIHGKPFKPEVCALLDAATRAVVGWSTGLAESAMTVADAVRHAATVTKLKPYGGVFNVLYTDGGSGNTAKINTDEFTGLFARIGTTHKTGIPGNAQGRGLIERLNQSLWIRAAKQLPTFVGKDMDKLTERNMYLLMDKDIRQTGTSEVLLSWPQFLAFCLETVEAYNRRPHSALPKLKDPETGLTRHMTPLECWAWHMANGWQQEEHQLSEQEIEVLWRPREKRVVVRSAVEIGNNTYFNKVLEHIEGETVQVAYDIHDPEKVQIWNGQDQMVCYAFFEKNRTEYFPVAMVEKAAKERAQRRRQIKLNNIAEIDAEERGYIDIKPIRAEVIELQTSGNRIKVDRMKLEAQMRQPKELEIPHDDRGKYRLWQSFDEQMVRGEALDEKALRFYEAYRQTRSYRAFKGVEERLGQQQA